MCDYGCPQEGNDLKCASCRHPKQNHLYVHPHRCLGEKDEEGVHVVKSCFCTGFTLKAPAPITKKKENYNLLRSQMSNGRDKVESLDGEFPEMYSAE